MRKILLLGTIFVATSALAFSGVFGGGSGSSKQATYSGGADAIGVHFNGKPADSQPEETEETCPPEKQCGDYCCQGDNVCNKETNECCSEALDYCCPANQGVYSTYRGYWAGACCDGTIYIAGYDSYNDYNYYYCCPTGNKVYTLTSESGKIYELCCSGDKEPYCIGWDVNGECASYGCYNPVTQKVSCIDEVDGSCKRAMACDLEKTAYCGQRNSNGSCDYADCCSGVPSCADEDGNGVCTKTVCCREGYTGYCSGRNERGCYSITCCSGTVTRGEGTNPDTCDK